MLTELSSANSYKYTCANHINLCNKNKLNHGRFRKEKSDLYPSFSGTPINLLVSVSSIYRLTTRDRPVHPGTTKTSSIQIFHARNVEQERATFESARKE